METDTEIDLLPFYTEALSRKKLVWADIDKLYVTQKEQFYLCAKANQYYDCQLATERSLLADEYFKKCIGILSYATTPHDNNHKVITQIIQIFKKAYKRSSSFFKDKKTDDIIDYNDYISYLSPFHNQMNDDELNGQATAALFLGLFYKGQINQDQLLKALKLRELGYQGIFKISLDKADEPAKHKINEYFKKIPSNIVDYIKLSRNETEGYDFLYDCEGLSSLSIFEDIQFSKKEVQEIIYSYIIVEEQGTQLVDLVSYVIASLHIRGLIKAYKEVKSMYFRNNKETLYIEFDVLKEELNNTKTELEIARAEKQARINQEKEELALLQAENLRLQNEIRKLKAEVEQANTVIPEIIALRNFMFRQETKETIETIEKINMEELLKINGVVIGGHVNWINKLRESLPTWKIIDTDTTINEKVIKNAAIVIFNTTHLSHKMYYSVIDILRKSDSIKIGYVCSTNIENALSEIYESSVT